MDLYIDGVNDGGTYDGSGGPVAYTSAPATIARPGDSFGGVIDEVGIYDRALSAEEIQAIYRSI